jgi:hypothetical protein
MKRAPVLLIILSVCWFSQVDSAEIRGAVGNQPAFVPAWRAVLTSGGGQLAVLHSYSDGTLTTSGDTFGPFVFVATGSTSLDGTTYTAPAWNLLITSTSMPSRDVTWNNASSGNTTAVDIVAAPSNTNIMYMWAFNKVYVSTNRGNTWVWTGLTVNYNPNGANKNTSWMAVDPANPDIVYLVTPNGTFGPSDALTGTLLVNKAGRTCTLSCWAAISGIPAPSGAGRGCRSDVTPCGGNVLFDQTSAVVGGVTQGIFVNVNGSSGFYSSTNGGSSFTHQNAGTPPTNIFNMMVDKFGVPWAVEGFRGKGGAIYKYKASSWTQITTVIVATHALVAIMQDPRTGSTQANNQLIVIDNSGQIAASVNNGDTWTAIAIGNITASSASPQAGWLKLAQMHGSGIINMEVGAAAIDPSGNIFIASGIGVFQTSDPIVSGSVQTSVNYAANTVGINQLVVNQIISPLGSGPSLILWDRGSMPIPNPDIFATAQYPNKGSSLTTAITGSWSTDYVPGTPSVQFALVADSPSGVITIIEKSTDNGNTFSNLATLPSGGISQGGVIAASTANNLCVVPGVASGNNDIVSCTTNGGATSWTTASFTGNPAAFENLNFFQRRQPLTADRVTNGTFYIVDVKQNFFSSSNNGASFSPTGATSANVDCCTGFDRIIAAPMLGTFNTAGHVFYLSTTGHLWKSTNGAVSFASASSGLDKLAAFGFGAPKPGGNGYPTIYVYQISGGKAPQGYWYSSDGGATWAILNVPASEQKYASHVLDFPSWIAGDSSIYGRLYVGTLGSTAYYIDMADACPWVNWSNVYPNDSLTGTITLTAKASGLVPVTSVNFYVDGSLIGTQNTGTGNPAAYSQSWNASATATGAHTLKVQAIASTNSACSSSLVNGNSFSIPVTTH